MPTTPLSPHAILTISNEGGETMSMTVDTLPISQAAQALAFPEALLRHLVVAGVIAGDKSTCDLPQAAHIAARLKAAQEPVLGKQILISDAAKRYGFGTPTIHRWIAKGWVEILQQEPLILVNEGDMALARELTNVVGHVSRRAIFPAKPRSGRPRKVAA